ncbi:flagellar hook-length control protein FliK [Roseinatronobacter sp.]
MIPPTIVALTSLVAPLSSETGQGGGLSKLLVSSAPSLAQHTPALQFAELLGAARNQIAQLAQADPDPSEVTGDAMGQQEALALLASEIDDLVARLLTEPETIPTHDAVVQFLDILQGAEFANETDAIETLVENLVALDQDSVDQLNVAAQNPAALITVLADMARIPRSDSATSPGKPYQVAPSNPLHRHVDAFPPIPKADGFTTEKGIFVGATGPRPIIPNAAQVDTRALVIGAVVNASSGTEREAPPLPALPSEMRTISPSLTTALRPPEPAVPQPSGFARNLVQQIRSANISEGNTRIALAPRGLGEIEIDLRPDEAGKLRIVLRAENPAVLQALRGDRDGLLLALSDSGTSVDDAELEFEDFSRKQQKNDPWDDLPTFNPDADTEQEPQTTAPRTSRIGTGIVDILT